MTDRDGTFGPRAELLGLNESDLGGIPAELAIRRIAYSDGYACARGWSLEEGEREPWMIGEIQASAGWPK